MKKSKFCWRVRIIYPICITLLALFFISSFQGCKCYYKAQTVKPATAKEIRKYDSENKYFILHRDSVFWHLSGLEVNDERLAGNLSAVPAERWNYDITDSKSSHRYIQEDRYYVLDQVHLYLQESAVPAIDSNGHIKVALADIKRIEVYQKDSSRTSLSWGIPMGLTGVVATLFIAIWIFANNGNGIY